MSVGRSPMGVGLVAAVILLGSPACGESRPADERGERWASARTAGIAYLDGTDLELGLDVVVALQIVGEQSGDGYATSVAESRRQSLSPEDLGELGSLLDIPKTRFDAASTRGIAPPSETPDPSQQPPAEAPDVNDCLVEALGCAPSRECIQLGNAEGQWGYVLTHQAVWLLFLRWAECEAPLDVDARRRAIAVALLAEMRHDPVIGDLAVERLAMLGHLGFGSELEESWLDATLDAQQPTGCWRLGPELDCHPHVTGVALWALSVALDGE